MSLFEINSMIWALEKTTGDTSNQRLMTDGEFEASKERWRQMNLPDVKV